MAKTLLSSSTAFATGADLIVYRDWRHVADLVRDDDTRLPSSTSVANDATVAKALSAASGLIETACFRGGRYTPSDLTQILSGTVCKEFLVSMTCDLAFWILLKRRKPDANPRNVAGVTEALDTLEKLKLGEAVFPFVEVGDAGVMDYTMLEPGATKSTASAIPLDTFAYRMFGLRTRQIRNWGI